MASTAVVRARIDARLKQDAEAVLAANGLTVSAAVRLLLMRIAQEKALPFAPIYRDPRPIQQRRREMPVLITDEMRHYALTRAPSHFGFSGFRAAIASLYARSEGASHPEVNSAAAQLGSPQVGYINMLHQAKAWGHGVVSWDDPARGGRVHKLVYNPAHTARLKIDAPQNWREMNVPTTPPSVAPIPFVGNPKASKRGTDQW